MIPNNKSEPKHLKIERTSRTQKPDENSSKRTRKSNKLQTGNGHNHESFHSLGGQILYKTEEKSNPREQGNEKHCGWMVCLETLKLIYRVPSGPGKRPNYP
jgi:hypothetical protein